MQSPSHTPAPSPYKVALRWALQQGCAVSVRPTKDFGLGKSACAAEGGACRSGLRARAQARGRRARLPSRSYPASLNRPIHGRPPASQAFDWALSAADMRELDALRSPAGNPTLFSTTACPNSFFAAAK